MFGFLTRILAAILILTPTTLSASQAYASNSKASAKSSRLSKATHRSFKRNFRNFRGYRVIAGKHRSKRHRRSDRRIVVVGLGNQQSVLRAAAPAKPLVLQPVSRVLKVTEQQKTLGRVRFKEADGSAVRPNGKSWSVVAGATPVSIDSLRVEFLPPAVEEMIEEAVQNGTEKESSSSKKVAVYTTPKKHPVKKVRMASKKAVEPLSGEIVSEPADIEFNEDDPQVIYFDD